MPDEQLDLIAFLAGLDRAMTPEERDMLKRAKTRSKKRGHAMPPGTGPSGETCGSCAHLYRKSMSKTYLKCELTMACWTGGAGTDVRARDPACSRWAAPEATGAEAPRPKRRRRQPATR